MQVFVINLASAENRLIHIRQQLGGSDFVRIDAVNGLAVPRHLAENFAGTTQILPGEIGCYASHLVTAETILARGLPYGVVLEDDVNLATGFTEIVTCAIREAGGEWDIISLSGAKQHPHRRLASLPSGYNLVRYLHFPKTTAAYVISASGCRKLLKARPRRRPIDVDIRYGWEMGLEGYGIFPPPAQQSGRFASSIPKSKKQRFYWRADPRGYLAGRIGTARRFGITNLLRALIVDRQPH